MQQRMKNHYVILESDGGITLPPELIERLGLSVGDHVDFEIRDEQLVVTKTSPTPDEV